MYVPSLGPSVPRRGNAFWRAIGRLTLRLMRFRLEGEIPDLPKFVAIAAPHTSNWDFVVGISAIFALGVRVEWIGKHTLFRGPFGLFMRWLGGTPVERDATQGRVTAIAALMNARSRFVLGLSPEGTRRRVTRWKTGFYRIAQATQTPIMLGYFDYERRVVGLGPLFWPTGDLERDLAAMQEFYRDKRGRYPEQA